MPDPVIVPRADHRLSRRDIDPDALRVLQRLQQHRHVAYLVGGGVRDLLLGRPPKDFDIGTDAHPNQIKRLFKNCWIIGRRFRLAHVKFGAKTIEVATFRRNVADEAALADPTPDESTVVSSFGPGGRAPDPAPREPDLVERTITEPDGTIVTVTEPRPGPPPGGGRRGRHATAHRENTFGTPEEDAFRRDFTVNALFYDAATKSVIDYVGGLGDLERRVIRSIGDPRVRFAEDPVRMTRAAVLGARLGFDLDPLVIEAVAEHRGLIQQASGARLLEEYFKILRSGYAEASFRALDRLRLLELVTPELKHAPDAVWDSLARLDRYRQQSAAPPPDLSTTVLIGALLVPLGLLTRRLEADGAARDPRAERVSFGMLPVARKDLDRLRAVLQILPRLTDPGLPPRVARSLPHRPGFDEAVAWLKVFGDSPDVASEWERARIHRAPRERHAQAGGHGRHGHTFRSGEHGGPSGARRDSPDAGHDRPGAPHDGPTHSAAGPDAPRRRRRRRRRRRGRGPMPGQ